MELLARHAAVLSVAGVTIGGQASSLLEDGLAAASLRKSVQIALATNRQAGSLSAESARMANFL
jgi:hypothetical protein